MIWAFLIISIFINRSSAESNSKLFAAESESSLPRVALVIGNANYSRYDAKITDTPNAYNDAVDLAQKLRALNFEVIEIKNADREEMVDAITRLEEKIDQYKGEATALVYYAGHGLQIDGVNYMVPLRADISSNSDIRDEAVSMYTLTQMLTGAENRFNIIVLDACRDNPFEHLSGNNNQGWAKINTQEIVNAYEKQTDLPQGLFVAYATAPGTKAADSASSGNNGLFTTHLLKYIDKAGMTISELFIKVRTEVRRESGGRQISLEDSAIVGEQPFCFALSPCEKGMSAATKTLLFGSIAALFLLSGWFYYHRQQTSWVKGIDLKQMLLTDDTIIEQLMKKSRFGTHQIVGFLKDVANKKIICLINNEQSLILGRNIACNVVVDDDVVSSNHLEIGFDKEEKTFWIKDLDSTNQTWLGQDKPLPANEKIPIKSGELFYLANQDHPLVVIAKA